MSSNAKDLSSKVSAMEAALNEKLSAVSASEEELKIKSAALEEANAIAQKATSLMHHFRNEASELRQRQQQPSGGGSTSSAPPLLPARGARSRSTRPIRQRRSMRPSSPLLPAA